MKHFSTRLGLLLLPLAIGCQPAPPSPVGSAPQTASETASTSPTVPADSHAIMLASLREIAARAPDENPFTSDRPAREIREQLAELPADATDEARHLLLFMLGQEELKLGNTRQAIEHFTSACELADRLGDRIPGDDWAATYFQCGVAYMRLGETQNCCLAHNSQSCILPIAGGGIHKRTEGSRRAMDWFTRVLERTSPNSPFHLKARWLLNIAAMTLGEHPDGVDPQYLIPPGVFASDEEFPRFVNVSPEWKLDQFNAAGGSIADDFDGDGDIDLVVTSSDADGQMRLFRNRDAGVFHDRTTPAGLDGLVGGLNVVHADFDNDGFPDVLVLRGGWMGPAGAHPNSLLRNNGDGTFTDITWDAGLAEPALPTQTADWADYDLDGDLDLYIGNECSLQNDAGRILAPCQLFENDGAGTFRDIAGQAGVGNLGYTKGVAWGDYDGDRRPDLYVSNFREDNRLYHNDGGGRFSDVAATLGVTRPTPSFPTWFWDFNNDGALDLYVAGYSARIDVLAASYLGLPVEYGAPCLYRGDGSGGFQEVSAEMGLTRPLLVMGSNYGDLDNDGFLDMYLGTGDPKYENLLPNVMYRNRRGMGFADVTTAGGFGHLQKGHGVSFADLDADGDQDVFEEMGGVATGDKFANALYLNPGFGNHYLKIRLVGVESDRAGLGARLKLDVVEDGQPRTIYRHVDTGGSFGGNPFQQHVGIGRAETIVSLEVFWPTTGRTQVFRDVPAERSVRIIEGQDLLFIEG